MNNTGVYLDSDSGHQPISYVNTPTGLIPISKHWGSITYMTGKIYSTADDMGRYMRGLLSPDSSQIKKGWNKNLLDQIGKPVFTYRDNDKFSFGFGIGSTRTSNGLVNSHNGDIEHFRTEMHLFVKKKVGIFINTNSSSGHVLVRKIMSFFLENYMPAYADPPVEITRSQLPDSFKGTYTLTTYPRNDIGKIRLLTYLPQLEAIQNETGNLEFLLGSSSEKYVPIGSNKFADTTQLIHRTLSFGHSGGRNIIHTSTPFSVPVIATLQQLYWYETAKFQMQFRSLSLLLFIIVPLIWLVAYLIRKDRRNKNNLKVVLALCMWSGLLSTFSSMYLMTAYQDKDFVAYYVNAVPWQANAYGVFNLIFGVLALIGLMVLIYRFRKLRTVQKLYFPVLMLLIVGYAINNLIFNGYDTVF